MWRAVIWINNGLDNLRHIACVILTRPHCHVRDIQQSMMTSSNGNIAGPLWGEFTDHRRIPPTKAIEAELWCSLICAWTNRWVNNRNAVDLRRHRAHYDVTVMHRASLVDVYAGNGKIRPSSPNYVSLEIIRHKVKSKRLSKLEMTFKQL